MIILLTLIGFITIYLLQHAPYYYHVFPALAQGILLLGLLFFFNMSDYFTFKKPAYVFVLLLSGIMIFSWPISQTYFLFRAAFSLKQEQLHSETVNLVMKYSKPISGYFICGNCFLPNTLSNYMPLKQSSQFFNMWWIPGIVKQEQLALNSKQKEHLEMEKEYFIDKMISELNTIKPTLIFVDQTLGYLNKKENFNYLAFFNTDKHFQEAFKPYQFLCTADNFNVYRRIGNQATK